MSFSKQLRRERRAKMFKRIVHGIFNEQTLHFIGGFTLILITISLIPVFITALCIVTNDCAI